MYKINFDEINSYLNEVAATKGYDDISYHQPLGWDSFESPFDDEEDEKDNY